LAQADPNAQRRQRSEGTCSKELSVVVRFFYGSAGIALALGVRAAESDRAIGRRGVAAASPTGSWLLRRARGRRCRWRAANPKTVRAAKTGYWSARTPRTAK